MKSLARRIGAATVFVALVGCADTAPPEPGLAGPSAADLGRFVAPAAPPLLVSAAPEETESVARVAALADSGRVAELPRSRLVEAAALPWLRASPEGAAFLASTAPRALARGEPPERCPAAAAAPPGAADRVAAAAAALDACLGALARLGRAENCGCRLMAADETLLAAVEDFAYAPGVPALLLGPDSRLGLVAAALPPEAGVERVALRDAGGEVARLELSGERAVLAFVAAPEDRYVGRREPFGWRRGRLAERIVFEEPEATLLLDVSPEDLAR